MTEKKKWTKKKEKMYEDLCLDNYDEEYCYDFVIRETDDIDWDDGEPEEERYI